MVYWIQIMPHNRGSECLSSKRSHDKGVHVERRSRHWRSSQLPVTCGMPKEDTHTVPFWRKISYPNHFHEHNTLHTRPRARELICPRGQGLASQASQSKPAAAALFYDFRLRWLIGLIGCLFVPIFIPVEVVELGGWDLVERVILFTRAHQILEFAVCIGRRST